MLTPLAVAELMRGTGCYNLALSIIATAQGIVALLSGLAAGLPVDYFGYDAAFPTSAAVALPALAVPVLASPETSEKAHRSPARASVRSYDCEHRTTCP
ncbi:MAG TPA: hypothetical protein VGJ20_30680 [Xanthobacteraceae bacterium]